jgi:L-rhamnose mutarotase
LQRVCFTLKLQMDRIPEYIERHQNVWPEMQEALQASGWTNYTLFLQPDGLLIGYVEVENFDAALLAMKSFPVNDRWQAEMLPFFDSGQKADDSAKPLPEIFHLD